MAAPSRAEHACALGRDARSQSRATGAEKTRESKRRAPADPVAGAARQLRGAGAASPSREPATRSSPTSAGRRTTETSGARRTWSSSTRSAAHELSRRARHRRCTPRGAERALGAERRAARSSAPRASTSCTDWCRPRSSRTRARRARADLHGRARCATTARTSHAQVDLALARRLPLVAREPAGRRRATSRRVRPAAARPRRGRRPHRLPPRDRGRAWCSATSRRPHRAHPELRRRADALRLIDFARLRLAARDAARRLRGAAAGGRGRRPSRVPRQEGQVP